MTLRTKLAPMVLVVLALVLALAAACDGAAPRAPQGAGADPDPGPPPHVVLVCIDTLRADHTTVGGYERDTTPGLARIAAAGTLFERHFANAPWTKPSVATMLTGLLPPAHGAQWGDLGAAESGRPIDVLADGFDTLAEVLGANGWTSHAYVANTLLTANLGFAQGFDRFESVPATLQGDSEAVARTKIALAESTGPTFVWCHLMAPHNYQHRPARPTWKTKGRTRIRSDERGAATMIGHYRLRTRERALDIYDETVRYADELVAGLFESIRSEHPNTLLVVTSDHGEELGEHGGWLHGHTLYNELLRVPLVLWGPGVERGRVVREPTSGVDLFPTILELAGLPAHPSAQGRSLVDLDRTDGIYAEQRSGSGARRAWITADAKWIETLVERSARKPDMVGPGTWEHFTDPFGVEVLDGAAIEPDAVGPIGAEIERTFAASRALFERRTSGGEVQRSATAADVEALRALGYTE